MKLVTVRLQSGVDAEVNIDQITHITSIGDGAYQVNFTNAREIYIEEDGLVQIQKESK